MVAKSDLHIVQVGNVLVSPDIFTEYFCCDLSKCKGVCCVEGDAGAPVTLDEVMAMEDNLDAVWGELSASAQSVIDKQGVAYTDNDGDLVTSIVGRKDCVFTCYHDIEVPVENEEPNNKAQSSKPKSQKIEGCCLCAFERAYRAGKIKWCKPISCALYPIREKSFPMNLVGINYNRWDVCHDAVTLGKKLNIHVYEFLKEPLTRRFGKAWYDELCSVAEELKKQGLVE